MGVATGYKSRPVRLFSDFSTLQRSGHSPRCSPEKLCRRRAFSGTSFKPAISSLPLPFLLRYPAPISFSIPRVTLYTLASKRARRCFKCLFSRKYGSCRADLNDGDRHILCVSCLGHTHADHALSLGGCPECEAMSMATLRARLASFSVDPAPPLLSSGPRRKKRRSQRTPEASAVSACMPDLSPCASLSASPTSSSRPIGNQRHSLPRRQPHSAISRGTPSSVHALLAATDRLTLGDPGPRLC
ncbi:hypothetical protein PO909_015238 [Leuciscus waleckii]